MSYLYEVYDTLWYKKADPRITGYPLMGSPVPLAIIICAYWYMIKNGPRWMANKPEYNITPIIQMYNVVQIVGCACGGVHGLFLLLEGDLRCIWHPTTSNTHLWIVFYNWLYAFTKVVDLLDTAFFILRKKFYLVTTLHTYHHTLMAITTVVFSRYTPGGELVVMADVNSFVHAIMYFYYAYCLFKGKEKNIWWKKYITQLQLVQFCFILAFYSYKLFFVHDCPYPKSLLAFTVIQAIVMLYMFGKYYYRAFIRRKLPTISGNTKSVKDKTT